MMFKSFTSTTTMFGLFWIMALILPTRVSASPCFLCQDHHKTPSRTDCLLDPGTGKTCFDLYTQLLMNENWSECLEYRHAYQDVCCGDDPENICYTGPTAAPVYKGDTGDQPTCKICSTEEYPGKPAHIFSTRYIGTYNCGEYYERGQHGLIPAYLCGPLQEYAKETCGCGEYNPECIEDPTECYGYSAAIAEPDEITDTIIESTSGNRSGLAVIVACCVVLGFAGALVFFLEKSRKATVGSGITSAEPANMPHPFPNQVV